MSNPVSSARLAIEDRFIRERFWAKSLGPFGMGNRRGLEIAVSSNILFSFFAVKLTLLSSSRYSRARRRHQALDSFPCPLGLSGHVND